MTDLTEMIPDDLPEWAIKAMDEGQFFNVAVDTIESLTAENKELKVDQILRNSKECLVQNDVDALTRDNKSLDESYTAAFQTCKDLHLDIRRLTAEVAELKENNDILEWANGYLHSLPDKIDTARSIYEEAQPVCENTAVLMYGSLGDE